MVATLHQNRAHGALDLGLPRTAEKVPRVRDKEAVVENPNSHRPHIEAFYLSQTPRPSLALGTNDSGAAGTPRLLQTRIRRTAKPKSSNWPMRVGEPGVILSGMEARERPGYGPRRGRHEWLVAVLAMVLLFTFGLAGSGDAATAYDAEELEFVRLINDYREQNGLRPLILSDTLAVAAERHSEDMAEYSFFAHNTEGSSHYAVDSEPWDRMRAEGYDYNTYKGENLAVGYEMAEEAMRAWKESPSHNAAMLDGDYRVIGVARINAPGSVHGWYWTTDFGGRVDPSAHTPGESPQVRQPQQRTVVAPQDQPEETRKPPTTPYGSPAGPSGDTGALDNGRMGKVGGWSQKARDGADLVVEEGYARLGGYNDGERSEE